MNKRTRVMMRAGRKLYRRQIYGLCFDLYIEFYRRMEWKKPRYYSWALFHCDKPPRPRKWKIPKPFTGCKKPCVFCESEGFQGGNKSKKPKTRLAAKKPNSAISTAARVQQGNELKKPKIGISF